MPKKTSNKSAPNGPIILVMDRDEFTAHLKSQIAKGHDLVAQAQVINGPSLFESTQTKYFSWDSYNSSLLTSAFSDDRKEKEYSSIYIGFAGEPDWREDARILLQDVSDKTRRLDDIVNQINLYKVENMAKNKATFQGPITLNLPKEEFRNQIADQLSKGKEIASRPVQSESEVDVLDAEYEAWNGFNETLLASSFLNDDDRKLEEYRRASGAMRITNNLGGVISNFQNKIKAKINGLESLSGQIQLFREPRAIEESTAIKQNPRLSGPKNQNVFLVHGHDRTKRNEVEIAIRQLGLIPLILENQPNGGLTIIEKLERDSAEASYAVVIATADDEGRARGSSELKPRARQNVVLELGMFMKTLGRSHVAVLCDEGLEHPSDISGLVYITLDAAGTWKQRLAKELSHSGFSIDFQNLSV